MSGLLPKSGFAFRGNLTPVGVPENDLGQSFFRAGNGLDRAAGYPRLEAAVPTTAARHSWMTTCPNRAPTKDRI